MKSTLTEPDNYYARTCLSCIFLSSSQEVFDLLVKAYGADPRLRDNHGKTPRQYMVAAATGLGAGGIVMDVGGLGAGGGAQQLHLSSDTFRQLKDRRRNRRQASSNSLGGGGGGAPGILRFGSLSVRVKKTTEAFNSYFGSERKHSWGSNQNSEGGSPFDTGGPRKHSWGPSSTSPSSSSSAAGGADGLVISAPIPIAGSGPSSSVGMIDLDSKRMPPPSAPPPQTQQTGAPHKKRKSSKKNSDASKSAPATPTRPAAAAIGGAVDDAGEGGSDSEFGFDSQWSMPRI